MSARQVKLALITLFSTTALIWLGSRTLLAANFLPHWYCYLGNRRLLRGPELARRVTKIHPDIRVVYMSGYTEGFPETELPPNSVFLQKPFRFATLLEQLKLVRRRV